MRKDVWNTYATYCYTYDVANHPQSQGGVHHHQVKRTKRGWFQRILQSNGNHEAAGPSSPINDALGEERYELAKDY